MLKDERTLIIGLRFGSEECYKALYDLWFSRLYQFVLRYVKSESVTDDIVQDTFLKYGFIGKASMMACHLNLICLPLLIIF